MNQGEERKNIIVVDDDPMVAQIIEKATGKSVVSYQNTKQLVENLEGIKPISFFVDVHLELSDNGLDVIPKLKERWPFCPVIIVTGDVSDQLIVDALTGGADDFVHKPLHTKELLARMQVRMMELAKKEAKEIFEYGDLTVDMVHNTVSRDGKSSFLSPTEMVLLAALVSTNGTKISRSAIKKRCWGNIVVSDNALNRKIHQVRKYLRELDSRVTIRTVYGSGFIMDEE